MYLPTLFREERLDVQHALIRAHPLGLLVTNGPGGLLANPIPFVLDPEAGTLGTLRGHLARGNPQWREHVPEQEALVVFQGAERYITPSWYETKRETGKVVPTWNYAVVQARGRLRVVDDREWLARQIVALTESQEGARDRPWAVTDAPPAFVAGQIKGIVGMEIEIARIEGKWKVSQNRPEVDKVGVVRGLTETGDAASAAMAAMVASAGAEERSG